ncbi:MAG: type IV pilus twitching motility protein PilT [Planctomycetota bacterium]
MPEHESQHNELDRLFALMSKFNASDLHLKVANKPLLRVAGQIRELDMGMLEPALIKRMVYAILTPEQIRDFESKHDLDFAYSLGGVGRFRINIFIQRGTISMAARRVNVTVPTFDSLHLPPVFKKLSAHQAGLILVCGVTGSGKSTTLAAMIEYINTTRRCHIITIEDPIEYLYRDKKAFINQREVGLDVSDFKTALKYVVRQDPDVILVGEMRDPETFETGLTASETGHLVFGTLHSSTVAQTIGRIVDMFPADREQLLRQSLAFNLRGIACQKLLPSIKEGTDRVPAVEIMVVTPTIQKLIREKEDRKIMDAVRAGEEEGMQDFTSALAKLVEGGMISRKAGYVHAPNPEQLKMRLQGIYLGEDNRILG